MTLLRETDEKRGELLLGTAVYFVEGQKQESEIPGSGLRTWPPPGGWSFFSCTAVVLVLDNGQCVDRLSMTFSLLCYRSLDSLYGGQGEYHGVFPYAVVCTYLPGR